ATKDERIELTHRAYDNTIFARGALHAAAWLAGKPAGAYSLDDVLAA
ncbi:MAG TPA: dihydrodipicolinate reductase C-terminal domain-containing protein, partial [Rhodanobacteraceae bacterium]